ncbi:MAG: phosphoribosylformylglycinamidine synthase subunit PurQ, partial [Clostridia bacterium]
MAVVVEKSDVEKFKSLAESENLEATVVAVVTESPRLLMKWNGNVIVDISREFLNSNGAEKHTDIALESPKSMEKEISTNFVDGIKNVASDLNVCSKRGLAERFDSTIGAGTVLMPFGGKYQMTPIQAMANKISVQNGQTDDCSIMAWGYNPKLTKASPYHGAYLAVVESVSKLIASGASFKDVYLTFQEYFEKPKTDPTRWGKPFSAVLGAFKAQLDLGIAAIGGKDSMSGTFEKIDVPPTLVSFAVTTDKTQSIVSPEFKKAGNKVYFVETEYTSDLLPDIDSFKANINVVSKLLKDKIAVSAYTPTYGGIAEAVLKMTLGNRIGFSFAQNVDLNTVFGYHYGSFIVETTVEIPFGKLLGETTSSYEISFKDENISLDALQAIYENKLESIYSCNIKQEKVDIPKIGFITPSHKKATISSAKPRVIIPVFPGTNCEYDTAKAISRAGAIPEIFVVNNLNADSIAKSVDEFAKRIKNSQIIFIPGGFSGGDEPDGSGKFITAFFRNGAVCDEVNKLLKVRDGLVAGICNGFQALIKLGLVPYGEIVDMKEDSPTLSYNTISRHQSKIVSTRIASNMSPWLSKMKVGDIVNVPISHGEGRFIANEFWLNKLVGGGQIATQYVDLSGAPTSDIHFNPNNSAYAIEGITSPDGRVLGKMGHSERIDSGLYKNVEGNYDIKLFDSAVEYFK